MLQGIGQLLINWGQGENFPRGEVLYPPAAMQGFLSIPAEPVVVGFEQTTYWVKWTSYVTHPDSCGT